MKNIKKQLFLMSLFSLMRPMDQEGHLISSLTIGSFALATIGGTYFMVNALNDDNEHKNEEKKYNLSFIPDMRRINKDASKNEVKIFNHDSSEISNQYSGQNISQGKKNYSLNNIATSIELKAPSYSNRKKMNGRSQISADCEKKIIKKFEEIGPENTDYYFDSTGERKRFQSPAECLEELKKILTKLNRFVL